MLGSYPLKKYLVTDYTEADVMAIHTICSRAGRNFASNLNDAGFSPASSFLTHMISRDTTRSGIYYVGFPLYIKPTEAAG